MEFIKDNYQVMLKYGLKVEYICGKMAKIICKCGFLLSNSEAPNDIQLRVYTDKEWDDIINYEEINPWMIPLPKYDVWRCPKCKRIFVFEDNNDVPIMIYNLDKNNT
ncbi:hypothetical protein [Ruminococcus flavefaciens]|uniref:hypothetical protein n=1 Tax=Ruminococcus flavefaciens TaxID=1265 RepID=UPI001FA90B2E|nr:hypothetical protein [Ruminococcus flavefaciens]